MRGQEEKLLGGNTAESVIRLGCTVRKPATQSTPAVHQLLKHLRAAGLEASPDALGIDEQGRQVLEFVPGVLWHGGAARGPEDLRRVGALIRALHHVVASFDPPEGAEWEARSEPDSREILCHNDLAPWNLVCSANRWVFIDWDAAAPGSRLWDLAWAAITFPPFEPECKLTDAAASMHALVDGYGLETAQYGDLIRLMVVRGRAEQESIVRGAEAGQQPWARLHSEGHHLYWGPVSNYIDQQAARLHRMLVYMDSLK